MLEGEMVTAIRALAGRGVGRKGIARELGVAGNTVKRYVRTPVAAGEAGSSRGAQADRRRRAEARTLYEGPPRAMRWSCSGCSPSRLRGERADDRARGRRSSAGPARRRGRDGPRRDGAG